MKKILALLIIISAGYQGGQIISHTLSNKEVQVNNEPLINEPYVVVYGRNSCGLTQQTMKDLKAADIPFKYQLIDDKPVSDMVHARMESSGLNTRRYMLPIVEVNNQLYVSPKTSLIIDAYSN